MSELWLQASDNGNSGAQRKPEKMLGDPASSSGSITTCPCDLGQDPGLLFASAFSSGH